MADAAGIVARIRSHGANVQVEDGQLRIINQDKLPAGAMEFVRKHGKLVADWLEREGQRPSKGRAGPVSPTSADDLSRLLYENTPESVDAADWTWFVTHASKIFDEHLVAAA